MVRPSSSEEVQLCGFDLLALDGDDFRPSLKTTGGAISDYKKPKLAVIIRASYSTHSRLPCTARAAAKLSLSGHLPKTKNGFGEHKTNVLKNCAKFFALGFKSIDLKDGLAERIDPVLKFSPARQVCPPPSVHFHRFLGG
jgi:hypothetical protein